MGRQLIPGLLVLGLATALAELAFAAEPLGQQEQLQRDAQALLALAPDRRAQILKLDRDLFQETPASRERLLAVARRYRDWLDGLDDKDRQQIKDAPDKTARLALVRSLREQEWLRFQPRALREKLQTLQGQERTDLISKTRLEERRRHQEWVIATRFWAELHSKNFQPPFRVTDLPRDVQDHVTEYLKPMLTRDEKERLARAEGNWPLFPQTLVELADRHPPALPGSEGPRTFAELPAEVQKRLKTKIAPPKALRLHEGNWPAFAITVSGLAFRRGVVFPHELWPTHERCLSPAMHEFFDKSLQPLLTPEETRKLADARGKWPEYPQTLQQLAGNHRLQPPWFTLPGPRERWDNYRVHKSTPDQLANP